MRAVRVLFEPYLLYHLPQFLPFYELIRSDPRFDIRFSTSGHSPQQVAAGARALAQLGATVIAGSDDAQRLSAIDAFDPDILIIGWGRRGYLHHVRQRKRPCIIMIYHGIGVKSSYYTDDDPRIDYRAVESPYRAEQLAAHGSRSKALLCGCVKLDPLYDPAAYPREATLERLGLPADRPAILFAPTYYPSCIGTIGASIGTAAEGCSVLVKLHDYTLYHPDYAADLAVMQRAVARSPNVVLVPADRYNIIPLLKAADMLVTDASSVMFEYLVLDRPVIVCTRHKLFLRHRLAPWLYRRNRIDTQTSGFDGFYDKVCSGSELAATIEANRADPMRLSGRRREAKRALLHFDDGKSATRLLAQFEGIVAGLTLT